MDHGHDSDDERSWRYDNDEKGPVESPPVRQRPPQRTRHRRSPPPPGREEYRWRRSARPRPSREFENHDRPYPMPRSFYPHDGHMWANEERYRRDLRHRPEARTPFFSNRHIPPNRPKRPRPNDSFPPTESDTKRLRREHSPAESPGPYRSKIRDHGRGREKPSHPAHGKPRAPVTAYQKQLREKETDQHKIKKRLAQIDKGKNTIGYQHYCKAVRKEDRVKYDDRYPVTPDIYQKTSSRGFLGQLSKWRRLLHQWDDGDPTKVSPDESIQPQPQVQEESLTIADLDEKLSRLDSQPPQDEIHPNNTSTNGHPTVPTKSKEVEEDVLDQLLEVTSRSGPSAYALDDSELGVSDTHTPHSPQTTSLAPQPRLQEQHQQTSPPQQPTLDQEEDTSALLANLEAELAALEEG